ncbi:sensory transduction kinase domain protein, partial [Vibrio parahaemolyticus V-223/04]
ASKPK